MSWYKNINSKFQKNLPGSFELLNILDSHPLIPKIKENINAIYIIGSFASGTQNDDSDLDILLEIDTVKGHDENDISEKYRNKLRNYFLEHKIEGKADNLHPQWNGRRIDLYFTYDASQNTGPKVKIV